MLHLVYCGLLTLKLIEKVSVVLFCSILFILIIYCVRSKLNCLKFVVSVSDQLKCIFVEI